MKVKTVKMKSPASFVSVKGSLKDARKQHFSYIVDVSENMLVLANTAQWDELAAMETFRRNHLEQFFSQAITAGEAVSIKQGIERIIEIDRQLLVASEMARQAIAKSRKNLSKGQSAASAYSKS